MKFFITDVFAVHKYSGNQLATFTGCESLSDKEMQDIAREINFSETTFIMSDKERNNGYDVRIFTPKTEVDFAGHPALGTAYIIRNHIINKPVEYVKLNLGVGQIQVSFDNEDLRMKQIEPSFGKKFDAEFIAHLISLDVSEIDTNFPIEVVSTGLPFVIIPLKNPESFKKSRVNKEYYDKFISMTKAGILIFCPGGYNHEQQLSVRVFADFVGIPEDPATGSGNGCLAGYLVKNRYFGTASIDIKAGQGYEIGRPSQLSLMANGNGGKIEVFVGGKVISVAQGEWR